MWIKRKKKQSTWSRDCQPDSLPYRHSFVPKNVCLSQAHLVLHDLPSSHCSLPPPLLPLPRHPLSSYEAKGL